VIWRFKGDYVTSIGKIPKRECKIIIKMYQFAKELSNSDNPQLYELGHYLTDNIISKICMLVAIENNKKFTKKTHNGKELSLSFRKLYDSVLKEIYPSVPDYEEIESLHEERNIYQHEAMSIHYHFNRQYALDYLEKVKEIMIATNILDINGEIEATKYFSEDNKALPDNETKKKNKKIQKRCLKSLNTLCSYLYGIDIEYFDKDSSKVITSLNLLKTYKDLILPLGITYLDEPTKITTEMFQHKEGVKIFINIDCERSLDINLDLFQFKIVKIHKLFIDGRKFQDFEEVSQILECIRKKIL